MSLTTRLTAFFLAALAVVLIGFSTVLYFFARLDLHEDAEEQLLSALRTLEAAAQVRPDGIEWEPLERHVTINGGMLDNHVEWIVRTRRGKTVARSARYPDADVDPTEDKLAPSRDERPDRTIDSRGRTWLSLRRFLEPRSSTRTNLGPGKYDGILIGVTISMEPVRHALTRLAVVLTAVTGAVWLVSLFAGRWFCRRALRPVTRMADQARAMTADSLGQRLGVPANGDELQSLGESFNELLNRMQEAFERQRQFAGNASHQLRTPLAGLMGQVEVTLRKPREAADYRETLEKVQAGGAQLKQIIESLLFLTRADHEALVAGFEPISLNEWMKRWALGKEEHPRFADLRIEAADVGAIRAQPALLTQLVDNLFDNAAKYSAPYSPITIRVETAGDKVHLVVENVGPGLPAADAARLFEPFFRSESARRSAVPGTGLGLAVVKRVAESFNGTVGVDFPKGIVRFTIGLPRMPNNSSSL